MKIPTVFLALLFVFLSFSFPVYAQSADVTKIQTFIQSVIQIMVKTGELHVVNFLSHYLPY